MAIPDFWSKSDVDKYRQNAEMLSGGKCTIIYDAYGYPNVMVRIPAYRIQTVDNSLTPNQTGQANTFPGLHPAFIVKGKEVREIYVSKYLNTLVSAGQEVPTEGKAIAAGIPVSWPFQRPWTFDLGGSPFYNDLVTACRKKGPGWSCMTNATWSAIAFLAYRFVADGRRTWPGGNGYWGQQSKTGQFAPYETAVRVDRLGQPGIEDTNGFWYTDLNYNPRTVAAQVPFLGITRTGSGPLEWSHDGSPYGIDDLSGNVAEICLGLKLEGGVIQVIKNNDCVHPDTDVSEASTEWKAIGTDQEGVLLDPASGTPRCVFDAFSVGDGTYKAFLSNGVATPLSSTSFTYNKFWDLKNLYNTNVWSTLASIPKLLRVLGIFPVIIPSNTTNLAGVQNFGLGSGPYISIANQDRRICIRGGHWKNRSEDNGLFALNLSNLFTHTTGDNDPNVVGSGTPYGTLGFRTVYIPI
jgi:hypothetical protein